MEQKVYFKGLPTTMDINKLIDTYTKDMLIPDYEIPYDEVAEIVGVRYGSLRFKTITERWRKKCMNLYNIIIGCKEGEKSFIVLNEKGKLNLSGRKNQTATKLVKTSALIAMLVDRRKLTEDEAKELDFIKEKNSKMLAIGQIKINVELPKLGGI